MLRNNSESNLTRLIVFIITTLQYTSEYSEAHIGTVLWKLFPPFSTPVSKTKLIVIYEKCKSRWRQTGHIGWLQAQRLPTNTPSVLSSYLNMLKFNTADDWIRILPLSTPNTPLHLAVHCGTKPGLSVPWYSPPGPSYQPNFAHYIGRRTLTSFRFSYSL